MDVLLKIEPFVGIYRTLVYSHQPPGQVHDERGVTAAWLTGEGIAWEYLDWKVYFSLRACRGLVQVAGGYT